MPIGCEWGGLARVKISMSNQKSIHVSISIYILWTIQQLERQAILSVASVLCWQSCCFQARCCWTCTCPEQYRHNCSMVFNTLVWEAQKSTRIIGISWTGWGRCAHTARRWCGRVSGWVLNQKHEFETTTTCTSMICKVSRIPHCCQQCNTWDLWWCCMQTSTDDKHGSKMSPSLGICCNHGQVQLPEWPDLPEPLHHLLYSQDILLVLCWSLSRFCGTVKEGWQMVPSH